MLQIPLRSNLTRRATALVAADGTGVASIGPTSSAANLVRQVSVELAAAPVGAACTLRLNGAFVTALIATGDAAVEPPAVHVDVGDQLEVVWEGCTPGQVGTVLVIYDEVAPA